MKLSVGKIGQLFLTLGLVWLVPGCGSSEPEAEAEAESEMKEVVAELKLLRQDLAIMRSAITDIHRSTMAGNSGNRPAARAGAGSGAPVPTVTEVSLAGDIQSLGTSTATVGIVEFSDFQCPYCVRHHKQTFPSLKERYVDSGKVRYFFRDYPLGFHPEARPAAIAARCAARQSAFMPMFAELFANSRSLGPSVYESVADRENLDKDQFLECLDDQRVADLVDNDMLYAQSLGVSGTPTFFIGEIQGDRLVGVRRLVGAQSVGSFASVIDAKLQ